VGGEEERVVSGGSSGSGSDGSSICDSISTSTSTTTKIFDSIGTLNPEVVGNDDVMIHDHRGTRPEEAQELNFLLVV